MPRGGYQKPPARTPVGGPGRFARRNDALEKPATPGLDSPDLQYGDVEKLRQAARTIPINPRGGAGVAPRPAGTPIQGGPGTVPKYLLEGESQFPEEPVTTGLDVGAGAGREALTAAQPAPDLRELVLEYLYWNYDNKDAFDMLMQLREERAAASRSNRLAPGVTPEVAPPQEAASPKAEGL